MPKGIYPRRVKPHAITQPLDTSYRLIPLTRNQIAIVDAIDFGWLSQWLWYAVWNPTRGTFYACRREKKKFFLMHRVILGCKDKEEGDHWNHQTLDNRRENLRKCTEAQNQYNKRIMRTNTSGFIGVRWDKRARKWMAEIRIDGLKVHLGLFTEIKEAARVRDAAALEHHREFAQLNFP